MTEQDARVIAEKELEGTQAKLGKMIEEHPDRFDFEFETNSFFDIATMTVKEQLGRKGGLAVFKTGKNAGIAAIFPK